MLNFSLIGVVFAGIVLGFVGVLPSLALCRAARKRSFAHMGAALVVLLVSFFYFTVVLLAAYRFIPAYFLAFSLACMTTFLALFIVEACLAARWMQRTQKAQEERKRHKKN